MKEKIKRLVNFKLTKEETEKLSRYAEKSGLSGMTNGLRLLINKHCK